MSKLIILRGNSGSGKTTVARALQEALGPNTMLISHDMVRMQMLHVWGKEGVERSLPLMISLIEYGRKHSEFSIMEGILPVSDYLSLFEAAVRQYGKNIFAYYYELPFEETLLRHATKPNCTDFGEAEMRKWWQEKDFLPNIHETIFQKDMSLREAVKRIYSDVTD